MKLRLIILLVMFQVSLYSQKIELEDVWTEFKFYSRSNINKGWFSGNELLQRDASSIRKYDLETKSKSDLFRTDLLSDTLVISGYELSSSKKLLLLKCNSEALYRRSKKSYVLIYDLEKKNFIASSKHKVFNPSFSPDEKSIAYTYKNNIYVKSLKSGVERQLTHDGSWNHIINGRTDWVYEEEFGFTQAYQWVAGSNSIAYLEFDETDVKTYDMQIWGHNLYPEFYSYKYPKAGETNSKVSLMILDTESGKETKLVETDTGFEYLNKVLLTESPFTFCYMTNNRLQNQINVYLYDLKTKKTKLVYTEKSDKYVENPEDFIFSKNEFVISSYKSGYRHYYRINYLDNTEEDLTPGNFDATEYHGFSELTGSHYFSGYYDNSYTQSLCAFKNEKVKKVINTDNWVSASFSPDASWVQIETSSLTSKHEVNFISLKDKKALKNYKVKTSSSSPSYDLGKTEFVSIESEKGHVIPAYIIYPPDFDETKSYPLMMHCYGGPGHQVVVNKWNSFDYYYHQMLAQKGCIIVLADGRGTDGNGTNYRQASYGDFGKYEHEDQVEVARYFSSKKYVDSTRVGVWGWSFGGYLSSLCLLKSPDVFSMAIAVAPVTNWRYYDNIYTERYMGLPSTNAEGYDENSPTTYAKNLKGDFLLIHGTGDDNVHIQNSIFLQNELLKYNMQFETFYYPDKNHGIYGGTTRYNLYKKMTNFIEQNLIDNGN